jgi:hypothetical protein
MGMPEAHSADTLADSREDFDEVDANDEHLHIFRKSATDLKYSDIICQFCRTRIDEIGWCACDTIGGG